MIPGKFAYSKPGSVQEALGLLVGDDVLLLAGGQSLVAMMKLGLAQPQTLIDLNGIAELKGIEVGSDAITLGAMTSQAEIIASDELTKACPVLKEAALQIADPQVRNCGTIGGNAANGDPGNDMPAIMQLLDAEFTLVSSGGERKLKAREYYEGAYFTKREVNEILTKIHIPSQPAGHGWAYHKQKRKIGDYATAAVAVVLSKNGGKLANVSIALTNVADTPLHAADAASVLAGSDGGDKAINEAAQKAMSIATPVTDGRGPAEFRSHLVGVLAKAAIAEAISRCS